MHVAIYARHSTDKQAVSTSDQVDRCKKFCAKNGYIVAEVFTDEALSGAHMYNRPGIRALMEAALEMRFVRILAEDLSRFSRDQGDIANFFKRTAFLEIQVETIAEGEISELHIGLKGTMNALYLKDLADKTKRGQTAAVERGSIPGRTYGYDVVIEHTDKGELVRGVRKINQAESENVRWIFAQYAEGQPLKAICDELNRHNVPSPRGGKWVPTTLIGSASRKTGLLRQTLYKGEVIFNRMRYRKHPITGKRVSVLNPESEWLHVPAPDLEIISPKEFDAVQQQIEQRSSRRKDAILAQAARTAEERKKLAEQRNREWRARQMQSIKSQFYLFSGRLFCARHGEKILKIGSNHLYSCPHRSRCFNGNIRLNVFMPLILDALSKLGQDRIRDHFHSPRIVELRETLQAEVGTLTSALNEQTAAMNNVLDKISGTSDGASVQAWIKSKELEIARTRLDRERTKKRLARIAQPERLDQALVKYTKLLNALKSRPTDIPLHRQIRPFIEKITLDGYWSDKEQEWVRSARVDFDYHKMIEILLLDDGSPWWRTAARLSSDAV